MMCPKMRNCIASEKHSNGGVIITRLSQRAGDVIFMVDGALI